MTSIWAGVLTMSFVYEDNSKLQAYLTAKGEFLWYPLKENSKVHAYLTGKRAQRERERERDSERDSHRGPAARF